MACLFKTTAESTHRFILVQCKVHAQTQFRTRTEPANGPANENHYNIFICFARDVPADTRLASGVGTCAPKSSTINARICLC